MLSEDILVEISPDKKYPIYIDSDPLGDLEDKILSHTKANKVLVVISEKVDRLYSQELDFQHCIKYVLKDGEEQKNFKNYEKILEFASRHKLERKDCIVALGGGVVGDLAGFVASTYLRGIDFIQIPTTLLACVDSSVGGKVAINTKFGKNLVGNFYQPKAVFCNMNFLKTLDDRQFKTGLAEILKYSFIEKSCLAKENYDLFDFLFANPEKVLVRNLNILREIILISLNLKASVVMKDEKEQGLRKILNFGHTLGHAVEKKYDYKKYTHGEAVAVGIIFAFELARLKGIIDVEYKEKAFELIRKYSIIKKFPRLDFKRIFELMGLDKKVEDGKINFILPSEKETVIESKGIQPIEIKEILSIIKF